MEKCENVSGTIAAHLINPTTGKPLKRIRLIISGTSKFPGARHVIGKTGKELQLRRTLAYGIGVFCLTETGENQIGWIPEKCKSVFDAVGKTCHLLNFRAKIDSESAKTMGDNFTKIIISIMCEIDQ